MYDYHINPAWDGPVCRSLPADSELWDFRYLELPKLWAKYGVRGEGVNVYVIDSGISEHHSFGRLKGLRRLSFTGDGNPGDGNGHGSWCCGKIAAAGVGIVPGCNLASLKALDSWGRGRSAWVEDALEFICSEPDPHIVNMSLGSSSSSARQKRLVDRLHGRGCTVVAAAGNSNTSRPSYPAAYESALAVAAIDCRGDRAEFSNYGRHIVVAAPGVSCYSVFKTGFRRLRGTSMAAPSVAGLLALGASFLLKHKSGMDRRSMRDILVGSLAESAFDLGREGRDEFYGFGGINGNGFMAGVESAVRP